MRLTVPYAATIAAILMVSQASFAGELFPKVLVTVAPLAPYVDDIIHGAGTAQNLLRPGQDPHSFALAPSQARALDEADIIIVPDLSMNPVLARMIASKKKLRVIELSKLAGAEPLPYAAENPWLVAVKETVKITPKKPAEKAPAPNKVAAYQEELSKEKARVDPHFWLDPERMAAIAVPLADAIAQGAPESRERLAANAAALATHLRRDVMPPLRELLAKQPRTTNAMGQPETPFITYHAAYQYFLGRFGMAHYGEVTARPEETIGAKTMGNLLSSAEKQRVRCLIGEEESTLMTRVAKLSGAKVILLSPEQLVTRAQVDSLDWIKNDYDRLLYKTAKTFGECL